MDLAQDVGGSRPSVPAAAGAIRGVRPALQLKRPGSFTALLVLARTSNDHTSAYMSDRHTFLIIVLN